MNIFKLIHLVLACLIADSCLAQLQIISPHWEGLRYEIAASFNSHRIARGLSPVDITWIDVGGTSDILRFIQSEYKRSPNGIGIDLLYGGGIDPFIELKRAKLLSPIEPSAFDGIDLNQKVAGNPLHDTERYFASALVSTFGILCNRSILSLRRISPPNTWSDLAEERFRGWISASDPRRSGSSHLMFEIFLQGWGWDAGWEFLGKLASYSRLLLPSSPQVGRDVVNGEAACGLQIDSHAIAQINQYGDKRLTYIVPTDLPVMNGDGIAILKDAPNFKLAQEFLSFVLSEEGQEVIFSRKGVPGGPIKFELSRIPIRPELFHRVIDTDVKFNPFALSGPMRYSSEISSQRWNILNDLVRVFLIEHSLVGIQKFTMPITENDVQEILAQGSWNVPEKRLMIISKWRDMARMQSEISKNVL